MLRLVTDLAVNQIWGLPFFQVVWSALKYIANHRVNYPWYFPNYWVDFIRSDLLSRSRGEALCNNR
jgi:hypothetical protein